MHELAGNREVMRRDFHEFAMCIEGINKNIIIYRTGSNFKSLNVRSGQLETLDIAKECRIVPATSGGFVVADDTHLAWWDAEKIKMS